MLFNSGEFLIFLPVVFGIYWSLGSRFRWQNIFLIVASYVFYGWADWRYMGLIFGYTLCSFLSGILIGKSTSQKVRKAVLWSTVLLNIGVLMIYKYFDFFVDNFDMVFSSLGIVMDWPTLNLILPIGISFYTFQALSYTIDVYRGRIAPTRDVVSFFAFLSFFPQLVAGPIERADTLLPQFQKRRRFTYDRGVSGMKLILWGLFKKMVIADNCAQLVSDIFNHFKEMNSLTLAAGAVLFSFQIYGDFSGYSDIARGCGRLFGINLMENFRLPYFARNIKEFWRRWHISLNLWLRDYIYFPLGGSRRGLFYTVLNILIVFSISGLWHGANWTYIAWGFLNGLMIGVLILASAARPKKAVAPKIEKQENGWSKFYGVLCSVFLFCIVTLLWIIFRSENYLYAWLYIRKLFSFEGGWEFTVQPLLPAFCYIAVMLCFEIINRNRGDGLEFGGTGIMKYRTVRWGFYWLMAMVTFVFAGSEETFIYFQF